MPCLLKRDLLNLEFSASIPWLGEDLRAMKASRFTEAQKAFVLKQGEKGTPVAEVCRKVGDFCELAYCALSKCACPWADQRDRLEAQYMQVVARYRDQDDIRKMPQLMALALTTIAAGGIDFMGQVAGEIGALDAGLGQFFTPYEVSRLMAEINLGDAADLMAEKGFITIQEPAAGAGGMLIAAADALEAKGVALRDCWMEAIELSRSTYHMLYVQLAARGIAGRVTCGNSLSLESFTWAFTPAAAAFLAAHGHPFASQVAQLQASHEAARKKAALIAKLESRTCPTLD